MNVSELFEDATPEYYHITTKFRLKSIMDRGIEPGHKRRWDSRFGAKLGRTSHVYLISDFTQAVRWAGKMQYDFKLDLPDVVILVLNNVPGVIEPDPNLEGQFHGNAWFQVANTVPPSCITRVIPLTREMIRELVKDSKVQKPA